MSDRSDLLDPTDETDLIAVIASGLTVAHRLTSGGNPQAFRYPAALQRGLDRLTVHCLLAGETPPAGVPDLLRWCTRPLGTWRPALGGSHVAEEVLLDAGVPTRACAEWAVESADVETELVENRLIAAVRATGRPDTYTAFRTMLIREPVLTELEFEQRRTQVALRPVHDVLGECYRPATAEFRDGAEFVCCRDCRSLLLPDRGGLRCVDDRCPRRGAPRPGRRLAAVTGVRSLIAPMRLFVASPGRAELRLHEALRRTGVEVELWPALDAYDLRITLPNGQVWAVDVKDWSSPVRLARRLGPLRESPPWDRAFVVPAREAVAAVPAYLKTLRAHLGGRLREWGLDVVSEHELVRQVRRAAEQADA